MNLVLLSGGSGQRLWPLSNDVRSKQFIKIFHRADGELESMVQRVYRQIREVDPAASVTIATAKSQVSAKTKLGIKAPSSTRDSSRVVIFFINIINIPPYAGRGLVLYTISITNKSPGLQGFFQFWKSLQNGEELFVQFLESVRFHFFLMKQLAKVLS